MKIHRLLACTAAVAGTPFAMVAPAHAIPLAAIELPVAALSALSGTQGCGAPLDPAFGQATSRFVPGASKSAAILGGQVSQLDLIRQQQAGSSDAALANVNGGTASGSGLVPAAAPAGCQRLALAPISASSFQPALRRPMLAGPDDFLASRRLPVLKTSFDSSWNRVSRQGLSRQFAASLLGGASGAPTIATLEEVNAWSNARIRYEDDSKLYGRADYWASASTTLHRGAGDCEDIAILKMQLLAAMGVPRSDMYLTIARDLDRHADHALLIVKLDDKYWLLDNSTNRLLDASQSYDYRPVLSFNTSQKWLHGY